MASCPKFEEFEQQMYIIFRAILEIPTMTIHDDMVTIGRDDALSHSTVRRWVNLFREGG